MFIISLKDAFTVSVSVFLISVGSVHAESAAKITAEEIMKRNFLTNKVKDSISESTYKLTNPSGQDRLRTTRAFTKLKPGTTDNMRFIHFISPPDIKGTKTLMIESSGKDDDIWIYLPAMKKVRRLLSSNKRDSFAGTVLSYGDVIGYRVENWNHKILKEERIDPKDCYVIESLPKTKEVEEETGYSKRITWIDKESWFGVKVEVYDPEGQLLKTINTSKITLVDAKNKKWQAMSFVAHNVQTQYKTTINFTKFKANAGVTDDVFTPRSLEK